MTFLYPNVQINHRVIFFLLMLMAAPALGAGQEIRLYSAEGGVSNAGHIKLEWQPPAAARIFEVQQAGGESFSEAKTIYQGPDRATFISGLENGTYYFRVREQGQDWSNVLKLEVIHHSLTLTYVLLGLGGLVFLCTAGMVLYGVRKSAQIQ
ncbi:hypothetical protein EDD80_101409 [Anseongella ginsenosidimutans]|uniref:Fibronectin type-III domain-containing protein n=1 Tax=Anseongella ginsenosidimutans TaxID=496056 RepID=A0A4R3KZZ1_9SPHI|nr:hypothetical protein [Anseongella ginsenosidimutans]QEC51123.1 hypothetical protein FRZ59_01325 [Anseongella ginsenosidimutans]TCS90210.1 hypothetical protein EDD80_101409 [Anseongella ginsenosidimutans]